MIMITIVMILAYYNAFSIPNLNLRTDGGGLYSAAPVVPRAP